MGLTASYIDGKLATGNISKAEEPKAAGNTMDKEAFLQLLVAQMKYQDPLQPTSNTEYISQYATFSELEQMQNMSSSMTLSRASELVGKEVLIETETDAGKITQKQGNVEKVVYQSNKAYLSIDGALYSMDDLKYVIDDEYSVGNKVIGQIQDIVEKLPAVEDLTTAELADVLTIYNLYAGMSDYQVSMMGTELEGNIQKYISKMNEIVEAGKAETEEV